MHVGRKKLAAAILVIACLALVCIALIPSSGLQDNVAADQSLILSAGEEMLTPPDQAGSSDQSFTDDEMSRYAKNMDIWFMLMLVAFLMIFIRKFEWGVALATLLVTVGSFISYMAIQQFYFGADIWDQSLMIRGVICSITVVIAIGVFLGTTKMWQYILVGVLFAPVYSLVEWFMTAAPYLNDLGLGTVTDPGGSIMVHMCAAYFGIGVLLALREKRAFKEPMYTTTHSITFVWLASMLLFILWPSFVTSLLPADQVTWGLITCYMSGLGSMLTTYIVLEITQKKVNPLIYTYAMLAGPVAIGSPLLLVDQWGALVIGLVAGALSALAFVYLQPWLCKKMGALDVMGVHNLHGVGGWIGALSVVVITGELVNAVAAIAVAVIVLVLGFVVGLIVRLTRGTIEDDMLFNDDADFIKSEDPAATYVQKKIDEELPATETT